MIWTESLWWRYHFKRTSWWKKEERLFHLLFSRIILTKVVLVHRVYFWVHFLHSQTDIFHKINKLLPPPYEWNCRDYQSIGKTSRDYCFNSCLDVFTKGMVCFWKQTLQTGTSWGITQILIPWELKTMIENGTKVDKWPLSKTSYAVTVQDVLNCESVFEEAYWHRLILCESLYNV